MTVFITGKISMQNASCEKCGALMQLYGYSDIIRCNSCGSAYLISASESKNDGKEIEFQFDFKEFQCVYKTYSSECTNVCPSLDMYCKEHTSDECFEEIKRSVQYTQERLDEVNAKLNKMEESKRIWLIEEMSGIK